MQGTLPAQHGANLAVPPCGQVVVTVVVVVWCGGCGGGRRGTFVLKVPLNTNQPTFFNSLTLFIGRQEGHLARKNILHQLSSEVLVENLALSGLLYGRKAQ